MQCSQSSPQVVDLYERQGLVETHTFAMPGEIDTVEELKAIFQSKYKHMGHYQIFELVARNDCAMRCIKYN